MPPIRSHLSLLPNMNPQKPHWSAPPSVRSHVFFSHALIADPSKAFDGDADQNGYNQVMTTIDEFNRILEAMYEKGICPGKASRYGLRNHRRERENTVREPEISCSRRTRFLLSCPRMICYYPYMDGDGFANRLVIGEDSKPTCQITLDDGTVTTGDYDLVPILEKFCRHHPDFSYKGARAVLAFTGYEGILGYRTSSAYTGSETTYDRTARLPRQR